MNSRTLAFLLPLPVVALALASGCALTEAISSPFRKDEVGLTLVDQLVDRVERVHVETEVAKVRVHEVLDSFAAISAEGFSGDPIAAHARCAAASTASNEQAERLHTAIDAMEAAAEPYFLQWQKDLDAFVSAEMRERSSQRRDEARARYDAVRDAALPAHSSYESFNKRAQDLAVFLENDLNAGALSAIEGDVRDLTDRTAGLAGRLDATLRAAELYVQSSALPGRPAGVEGEAPAPAQPAPSPAKAPAQPASN